MSNHWTDRSPNWISQVSNVDHFPLESSGGDCSENARRASRRSLYPKEQTRLSSSSNGAFLFEPRRSSVSIKALTSKAINQTVFTSVSFQQAVSESHWFVTVHIDLNSKRLSSKGLRTTSIRNEAPPSARHLDQLASWWNCNFRQFTK